MPRASFRLLAVHIKRCRPMFWQSNQKLDQIRESVGELIADFDSLLLEVRDIRRSDFSTGSCEDEPVYVQRFSQQRATLVSVAAMLANMRLEWSQQSQGDDDGERDHGGPGI